MMTEKRFIEPNKECRVIKNTKTGETAIYYDTEDGLMFLKWLNELHEENEQLKKAITTTDELLMNQWKENQRIKHTIKEAHYNERTAIGKNVLKQLIEQME